MKPIDKYHRWVEWSDEDQVYVGRCPDLITAIHGDDPVKVYEELGKVVQEVIDLLPTIGPDTARAANAADEGSYVVQIEKYWLDRRRILLFEP